MVGLFANGFVKIVFWRQKMSLSENINKLGSKNRVNLMIIKRKKLARHHLE